MTKIERTTIWFCAAICAALTWSTIAGDPFGPVRSWFALLTSGFRWGMGS